MHWLAVVYLLSATSLIGQQPIILREGLVTSIPRGRRVAVHIDPVELSLVRGTWQPPREGQDRWSKISANKDGWFEGQALGSGYVYTPLESDRDRIALLEAAGSSVSYVNGEPRAGDPYQYGYVSLPIQLKKGTNHLLFLCGRGRLKAQVVDPPKPVSLDLRDPTTPDLTPYVKGEQWAAVVVRNATTKPITGAQIACAQAGKSIITKIGSIPAMSVRKVGFKLNGSGTPKLLIRLIRPGQELDRANLELRQRKGGQTYKRTFLSGIDGSVQYYAVNPSTRPGAGQALFLSLHGASVEAIGQADAYAPKSWGHLVAPTNRRPFGFDWEEVGRLDALEVLAHAQKELQTDPRRTYLTGHSMGGHGTWNVGAHYPGKFAAIAPSAGWISFWTYAGGANYPNPSPVEQMLVRSAAGSDTLALKRNFLNQGVYVLHGDADDNVPVTEARKMREELTPLGVHLGWHEQKGAGHWWDDSDEPGAACVDWPAIFDLFSQRRLPTPREVRTVDFTTASPGISSSLHWATIQQQLKPLLPSSLSLRMDPLRGWFVGTTSNVARLALDLSTMPMRPQVSIELDGQKIGPLSWPESKTLYFMRAGTRWVPAATAHPHSKKPERYGGFKDVFRNRLILVYGTGGNAAENAWAYQKARFDAESFWYRGNASVDVVADTDFDPRKEPDRNVLLYGNSVTNRAWAQLLSTAPITVKRGSVTIGEKSIVADDYACVFIMPRPASATASVGVVAGTGIVGMRLTDRLPFFTAGAGFPDVLVIGSDMLEKGTAGVRAIGFFGMDWRVETGEIVWNVSQP